MDKRRCVLRAWLLLLGTVLCGQIVASDDESQVECGQYDHNIALKFKNEYLKALQARDYPKLKELQEQRKNTDFWAKTEVECFDQDGEVDTSGGSDDPEHDVETNDGDQNDIESVDECPDITVSNIPSSICLGDSNSFSVTTEPKNLDINVVSKGSSVKLVATKDGYDIVANTAKKEPTIIEVSHKSCAASRFEVTVAPKVVNDLWNFPLVGDPDAGDVNQAYDYFIENCPSTGQNPINHSIDGCSGPAPQRLTESSAVTNLQFEIFDKFRPGFEPIWGEPRPNGVPSGGRDSLACNNHDICYQTCGETQEHCDAELRQDIEATCNLAYPNPCPYTDGNFFQNKLRCQDYNSERTDCRDIARNFQLGLSLPGNVGGRPAFRTRQVQYCKCCD